MWSGNVLTVFCYSLAVIPTLKASLCVYGIKHVSTYLIRAKVGPNEPGETQQTVQLCHTPLARNFSSAGIRKGHITPSNKTKLLYKYILTISDNFYLQPGLFSKGLNSPDDFLAIYGLGHGYQWDHLHGHYRCSPSYLEKCCFAK